MTNITMQVRQLIQRLAATTTLDKANSLDTYLTSLPSRYSEGLSTLLAQFDGYREDLGEPIQSAVSALLEILSQKSVDDWCADSLVEALSQFDGFYWHAQRGRNRWSAPNESYRAFRSRVGTVADGLHLSIYDIPHAEPEAIQSWLWQLFGKE